MAGPKGKSGKTQKKHPKEHKQIRQEGRPNGKRWKRGLPPEKRNK